MTRAEHEQALAATYRRAALQLEEYANGIDFIALLLDNGGEPCIACGVTHYRNWPQKQLRDRVDGVAIRCREIADTLKRRAADPDFLYGIQAKKGATP